MVIPLLANKDLTLMLYQTPAVVSYHALAPVPLIPLPVFDVLIGTKFVRTFICTKPFSFPIFVTSKIFA